MKFNALESWRGLCAIGVVLVHVSLATHILDLPPVQNAGFGVDFFFVLSGFVLAHAYSERLKGAADARNFLIRRIGRLLPLHLVMLAFMVLLELAKLVMVTKFHVNAGQAPFSAETSLTALGASVVLVNGLGILPYYAWNGPSWSISTEFWAYLLFLGACLAGARLYRLGAVTLCVLCGGALWLLDLYHVELHTYEGAGVLRCLFGFSGGMLVNLAYRRIVAHGWAAPAWLEYVAVIAVAGVFCGIVPWARTLGPIAFGFAIFVFAFESGAISRVLKTRVPLHLGQISYSIYLVHFPLLAVVNGVARAAQSVLHVPLYHQSANGTWILSFGNVWLNDLVLVALLLLIVGVATLTYRLIENPGREYFNRLAGRRDTIAPSPARSVAVP